MYDGVAGALQKPISPILTKTRKVKANFKFYHIKTYLYSKFHLQPTIYKDAGSLSLW